MTGVVDRWMAREVLFASVIITLVLSGPVILISLFTNLPSGAIYTELVWPSLASIAPMILYHTLPVLVAVAVVWCYGRFSTDGTLITLYLTGRSNLSVRAPGLFVAVAAALVGYGITNLVIPRTSGYFHDVIYGIRHQLNPALLKTGEYNDISRMGVVIFFKKRSGNEFSNLFLIKKMSDGEERAYVAERGVLKRGVAEKGFVLLNGSLQILRPGKELQSVNFEYMTLPLTDLEDNERSYTVIDELDTMRFLKERKAAFQDLSSDEARSWMREAAKRFVVPSLVLPHTWLGLELLTFKAVLTDRKREPVALICAYIALLHFILVIFAEHLGMNIHWIWLLAAIIIAELALAAGLMLFRTAKVALPS